MFDTFWTHQVSTLCTLGKTLVAGVSFHSAVLNLSFFGPAFFFAWKETPQRIHFSDLNAVKNGAAEAVRHQDGNEEGACAERAAGLGSTGPQGHLDPMAVGICLNGMVSHNVTGPNGDENRTLSDFPGYYREWGHNKRNTWIQFGILRYIIYLSWIPARNWPCASSLGWPSQLRWLECSKLQTFNL